VVHRGAQTSSPGLTTYAEKSTIAQVRVAKPRAGAHADELR
jgi:hypothetical protein